MKKIFISSVMISLISIFSLKAQCGDSSKCIGNSGLYSNNDAANIEYDNMGSSFHSSFIKRPDGTWQVWGESLGKNGYDNVLSPTEFNGTNYDAINTVLHPELEGIVIYKMAIGSNLGVLETEGIGVQLIVLTSKGLFVLGSKGIVIDNSFTLGRDFQKIKIEGDAKEDGLPPGVTPLDVKMLFASLGTLTITTCTGEVYVLSKNKYTRGDGGIGNSKKWSRVMVDDSTPLEGVIVTRGVGRTAFALKADGTLWTWGENTYLGNGTPNTNRLYATQMILPSGISGVKMIQATRGTETYNVGHTSYYVLGNDKMLYTLGANNNKQLGDLTRTERRVWVNAKDTDGFSFRDIEWISSNEHDEEYASIAAIRTGGNIVTAGSNNSFMIGRINQHDNDFDISQGINQGDVITFVEVGGHTTALIKAGTDKYGYTGHRVNGSMGNGTSGQEAGYEASFNFSITPEISVCGKPCKMPVVTTNTPICPNQDAIFTIKGTPGDLVNFKLNNGDIFQTTIESSGFAEVVIENTVENQSIGLTYIQGGENLCSNNLNIEKVISVNQTNNIEPVFDQVEPICQETHLDELPLVSNNNIEGVWTPAINNLQTTIYTFTPNVQCGREATMTIVVNPKVAPVFYGLAGVCDGESGGVLPTSSDDLTPISGVWVPDIIQPQTGNYVFTPNAGECARVISKEIEIYDLSNLEFEFVSNCQNGNLILKIQSKQNGYEFLPSSLEWYFNEEKISSNDNNFNFNVNSFVETLDNPIFPLQFKVIAYNSFGCAKENVISIDNLNCIVSSHFTGEIPKGISPNEDGKNDFLDLKDLNVKQLTIYNRYGVKVYSKVNYINEWKGQTDSGATLPDGVYFYSAELESSTKAGYIYINK